jgi:ATP-dependent helicase IRC3
MANLVAKIPPRSPKAIKTLVLAHREELLDQAQRQISSINPKLVRISNACVFLYLFI